LLKTVHIDISAPHLQAITPIAACLNCTLFHPFAYFMGFGILQRPPKTSQVPVKCLTTFWNLAD